MFFRCQVMQSSPDLWPYIRLKQVAFIYEIYAFCSTFPACSARNFTVRIKSLQKLLSERALQRVRPKNQHPRFCFAFK